MAQNGMSGSGLDVPSTALASSVWVGSTPVGGGTMSSDVSSSSKLGISSGRSSSMLYRWYDLPSGCPWYLIAILSPVIGILYQFFGVTYLSAGMVATDMAFQVVAHMIVGAVAGAIYKP